MAMERAGGTGGGGWRWAMWGGAAAVLLVPAVATRWTDEVRWDAADFAALAAMLAVAGALVELAVRRSADGFYRAGAGAAALATVGLAWVNLAVGVLGEEGNPANLLFAAVPAVAVAGAWLARGRAAGMARAMAAAAAVQALVGLFGLAAGWASPGEDGVYEVALATVLFGGLWLAAAGLFHAAARRVR